MASASVVVAGAGAVGSTVALVLAEAGHRVLVIDPSAVGANASGVAAGMLSPAFESLFDQGAAEPYELLSAAQALWPARAERIKLSLDCSGALALGSTGEVAAWAARLAQMGAPARMLTAKALTETLPQPAPGLAALACADEWRLTPTRALATLHRAARGEGVGFLASDVRGFAPGALAVAANAKVSADWLVIATGASKTLGAVAPDLARLTPVKGHILRSSLAAPPGPTLRTASAYVCPTGSEVILGASMEVGRDDAGVDPDVVTELKAHGAALCPSLAGASWRVATGVRAASPDGLPMVGESGQPRVILAVGARRNGWLLAPLIAEIVAGRLAEAPKSREAQLFDPGRFSPD
jgi:glycine oxidase